MLELSLPAFEYKVKKQDGVVFIYDINPEKVCQTDAGGMGTSAFRALSDSSEGLSAGIDCIGKRNRGVRLETPFCLVCYEQAGEIRI